MQPNQTPQARDNYLDWVLESREQGKQKKEENHLSQSLQCRLYIALLKYQLGQKGLIFGKYLGSGIHVDHTSDTIRAASSLLIDCPTWPIESCCYSDIDGEKQTESDKGPHGSSPPYLKDLNPLKI